ncbi:MAG TPA: SMC family ATPase [Anaerolineae bacterium]|nr:SMC family ATPase [Anaerolineae bacterium]HOQ98527.1 SMC family ATPase [Anaerolineae bacterium]HPL27188.1 SMC family ATPase [Anaerolineae bacterium]
MEIRTLELENVKSYAHETVTFARGTNAICGPNGAGKSTILGALGYALFDHVPCRPIANLVREGEKTATIAVTVLAADEREYRVVRRCGAATQYYVYDPELDGKVADGAVDVRNWLREQFGVDETVDLAALFHDAVGVPQGLLTAAFLEKPSVRRAVFNPLLRVEEYAQAFEALLDSRRAVEEHVHAAETLIAGLQAEARELPGLEEMAATLAQALESGRARLAELTVQLAALAVDKRALEAARDRLQKLTEEAGRLDERIAGLKAQLEQAHRSVAAAEEAQRALAESEPGHRVYLEAQQRQRALEARREERARLRQALSAGQVEATLAAERLRRAEEDLARAQDAAAEAERLQPKAEEQARLEAALSEAQGEARRWEAAARALERERARLAELETRLQAVLAGLEETARLEQERGERTARLESLARDFDTLRAEHAVRQAALAHVEEQSAALGEVAAAQCPVCEAELGEGRRSELLRRNVGQAEALRERLAELAAQEGAAQAEREAVTAALQALERRRARLPRAAEREALEAQCAAGRAAVQEARQEAERLAQAQPRAAALEAELAALGDPRRAYERALDTARERAALAQRVERERTREAAGAARLAELQGQLTAYAGLDEQVATVREALAAAEPDHRRYLQHEREAGVLPTRLAEREHVQGELQGVRQGREALAGELAAATAAYHAEDYGRTVDAYQQASGEESRLLATVEMQGAELARAQARIAHLHQVQAQWRQARQELAGWRELGQLLEYLRRTIKEAGPQITKALVDTISLEAAGLYSDITSDQISRLHWSEDYEVLLEHKSYQRTFQQLSGGEQMAAALAVRLALLREVSGIDIAFFDEPTSNLDDTRRENLAEQILTVKGFGQLFVVSHDDTFEQATDHIVRIAKEDGASRVVS